MVRRLGFGVIVLIEMRAVCVLSCSLPSVCCVLLLLPTAVGRRAGTSPRRPG